MKNNQSLNFRILPIRKSCYLQLEINKYIYINKKYFEKSLRTLMTNLYPEYVKKESWFNFITGDFEVKVICLRNTHDKTNISLYIHNVDKIPNDQLRIIFIFMLKRFIDNPRAILQTGLIEVYHTGFKKQYNNIKDTQYCSMVDTRLYKNINDYLEERSCNAHVLKMTNAENIAIENGISLKYLFLDTSNKTTDNTDLRTELLNNLFDFFEVQKDNFNNIITMDKEGKYGISKRSIKFDGNEFKYD